MFARKYECVVIFDVQMTDVARDAILKELEQIVTTTGGQVLETEPFGIRTLTIDLKGRHRGDYRIVRFTTGPETLQRIDRLLRMKEEVLRFMVTKILTVRPRKVRVKKPPKEKEVRKEETEGEVVHGKSEQSVSDREHHPSA